MKVSIVMPAYNAEITIENSILSVLHQTYSDLELIIINDGSTDSTHRIIEGFKQKDSRIRVLDLPNSGVSIARNAGIDVSTGEYLMFLDSDDYIEKETVEVLLNKIVKYRADLVSASLKRIDGIKEKPEKTSLRSGYFDKNELIKEVYPYIFSTKSLHDYIPLTFCTKIYSSKLIKDNKIRFLPDLKIAEDNLFSMTCFLYAEDFYYLPDFNAYNYVNNTDSVTNTYINNCWKDLKTYFSEIEKLNNTFQHYCLFEQLSYALLRCAMTAIANESKNVNSEEYIIKENLIKITKDKKLQSCLKEISTNKMSGIRKMITFFLKRKNVNFIFLLVKVKYSYNYKSINSIE